MQVRDQLPDLGAVVALQVHNGTHAPAAFGGAGDPERLAEDEVNKLGLHRRMSSAHCEGF